MINFLLMIKIIKKKFNQFNIKLYILVYLKRFFYLNNLKEDEMNNIKFIDNKQYN